MRLTFLWAESAVATAGDGFAAVEATLPEDVKGIAAHARSWFVHSSPPDGSFPTWRTRCGAADAACRGVLTR